MEINGREISPELIEKAKACKTDKELFELAREEGIELSDADLEAVSGGSWGECNDQTCKGYRFCPHYR